MGVKPDILSRRSNHSEVPNPKQTMIESEKLLGFKADVESDLIEELKESQEEDESLQTLIESTKGKANLPASLQKKFIDYSWEEELLWYKDRIVVGDNQDLRLRLMHLH